MVFELENDEMEGFVKLKFFWQKVVTEDCPTITAKAFV